MLDLYLDLLTSMTYYITPCPSKAINVALIYKLLLCACEQEHALSKRINLSKGTTRLFNPFTHAQIYLLLQKKKMWGFFPAFITIKWNVLLTFNLMLELSISVFFFYWQYLLRVTHFINYASWYLIEWVLYFNIIN